MFQINSLLTVVGVALMFTPTSDTLDQGTEEPGVIPNVTSSLVRDSSDKAVVTETLEELPNTLIQANFILL